MPTVDLLLPELSTRDATGAHTLLLRDLLVGWGADVRIVVERVVESTDIESTDVELTFMRNWRGDADMSILQHATGSQMADEVFERRLPIVVNYHNVTPWEFFEPWEPELIAGLRLGRAQLWALAPLSRLGLADSGFNARELVEVGVGEVVVAPILFDRSVFAVADEGAVERFGSGSGSGPVWLFVGRLAPNKAQHDLIAAFAAYRAEAGGGGRLVLVGAASSGVYRAALAELAVELGVGDAVVFAGSVSAGELAAWYRVADVFVCLSEHEGFCVPLLEAMHHRLPVVAFDSSAVPETLAGAGLVLGDKSPVVVAEAVDRLVSDPVAAQRLVARGVQRLADFDIEVTSRVFIDALTPLLEAH
jgi:glycosyltransferase involved in cell wall biosynthesis